jgi:meso-butanediol dehydrogenase / (S,S)-butanediol dehydrogenase / diacetyl reductase
MSGRVVVITGGASGLGAALAQHLAGIGDTVIVADIDADAARDVAHAIGAVGGSADHATVDVTNEGQVADFFGAVADAHGRLDGLVCSAAVETRAGVLETSDEGWQQVLDVNLKGPFLCMKHGIPPMATGGGGSVVLLGSTLAHIGSPGFAAYCASKGALVNLAKQAAIEHAPDGVRVNVVSPGACEVGLFQRVADEAPDPQALKDMVARRTPMGRLGRVEDVAATVEFLLGDGAAFISGTTIPLDGGLAARRQ